MNIILSDFEEHTNFLPLSFTRSISDFRIGITTIKEKWSLLGCENISVLTEKYLQKKYHLIVKNENIIVNASIIPNLDLLSKISNLKNTVLKKDNIVIAYSCNKNLEIPENIIYYEKEILQIKKLTDIFSLNSICIEKDFELLTKNRKSVKISNTNVCFGKFPIFVEEGCFIECSTINAMEGSVYIGKNCKIMEGSHIRGPFAICEDSELKMGTKIYTGTTIGPHCKIGGEVNNTVFFGFSNKAHDGFIGNSVVGEWCNFGAGSNTSNLKNNYANVKLWNYKTEKFEDTGLQFCGLIMGDHSKCGINTMFNTGTTVGVSSNIFGAGFPRNFIPSFSWGGYAGMKEFRLEAAFEVMEKVMARRNMTLLEVEREIFQFIFSKSLSNSR
ncbi:MAG: glucose-1-phosphate thymidylyltransferase [Bacteroidales bacterium]|jgi:UDP-N-acetylglucosamine diphosphorylase/glucosamine-1-phosphate N-acetyltransferase|nr:glucose-1-phosphate thymidylyltransferase [Bacteroidales bacterium]